MRLISDGCGGAQLAAAGMFGGGTFGPNRRARTLYSARLQPNVRRESADGDVIRCRGGRWRCERPKRGILCSKRALRFARECCII